MCVLTCVRAYAGSGMMHQCSWAWAHVRVCECSCMCVSERSHTLEYPKSHTLTSGRGLLSSSVFSSLMSRFTTPYVCMNMHVCAHVRVYLWACMCRRLSSRVFSSLMPRFTTPCVCVCPCTPRLPLLWGRGAQTTHL